MLVIMLQHTFRVLGAIALSFAVGGCAATGSTTAAPDAQASQVAAIAAAAFVVVPEADRQPVPAWDGKLLTGAAWSSTSLRGAVTVVNFWASWCQPCADEWPELLQAADQLQQVRFLGVNDYDELPNARQFVAEFGDAYDHVFDPDGAFFESLPGMPTGNLPTTIIIDADGRIAAWKTGRVTAGQIKDVVALA